MISAENLKKDFGPVKAVRGISFTVKKGEVLGFLGPNGAGKSTTMRMVTGFLPPTSGRAVICGHDMQEEPVAAKARIGYLPENAPAYRNMTVDEFLAFTARLRGLSGADARKATDRAIERCHLTSVHRRIIDTLSKGYRQRACFAQAIIHDPDVLIMDEPTDGLDPNQKHVVRTMIQDMARDKAIIVSTHILEEVDAVCSHAVIINQGVIVASDSPEALRRRHPSGRLEDAFRLLTIGMEGNGDEGR